MATWYLLDLSSTYSKLERRHDRHPVVNISTHAAIEYVNSVIEPSLCRSRMNLCKPKVQLYSLHSDRQYDTPCNCSGSSLHILCHVRNLVKVMLWHCLLFPAAPQLGLFLCQSGNKNFRAFLHLNLENQWSRPIPPMHLLCTFLYSHHHLFASCICCQRRR